MKTIKISKENWKKTKKCSEDVKGCLVCTTYYSRIYLQVISSR